MAAFVRHGLHRLLEIPGQFSSKNIARFYAGKPRKGNPDQKKPPIIDSTAKSLAAKGFLRSQKSYTPPENLPEKFAKICQNILENSTNLGSKKFAFLLACQQEFNHSVPNSLLHTMETSNSVLEFYKTPINSTIPLDMMKHVDLPENVHIQYDYHRFHPETDSMFNGVTAFPRSSTLVTGLKYKEKYTGHQQQTKWPYNT